MGMPTVHGQLAASERSLPQNQLAAMDRQIDRLVYELYGLTAEEIAIVDERTAP